MTRDVGALQSENSLMYISDVPVLGCPVGSSDQWLVTGL